MIVIDYSNVAIAAITGFREDLKRDEDHISDLIRHVILSTIKGYKRQFMSDYGHEIVLATDTSPYWRKDFFPHYKHGRKKARSESDIPWELVFKYMKSTLDDIRENFPWKVLSVIGAEADDIMAVMATDVAPNKPVDGLDVGDVERVLLISSDKDTNQLLSNSHVRVWSPYKRAYSTLDESPKMFLRRLILKGDSGDGIPGIFSPEDCFVTGTRQPQHTEKKLQPFLDAKNMLDATDDETIKNRIITNSKLIAFNGIPKHIRDAITISYDTQPVRDQQKVFSYLAAKGMKLLLSEFEQF